MYFAFQGVFSSWIWLHFETYIDHCHEVIHFAHESVFVFLWIRFPLCEHHITIWPNSPAKCRYRKKNHKFSKISRSLKLYSSWYSSWWWKYMQCWMNKTYCLSDTAQQLINENAACWPEGKTANTAIFLSVAPTPQRGLCSFLSLYLCYISSKQCFEEMRLVKV